MPYELVWGPRFLLRRYHGRVTGEELVACLRAVYADPHFDELHACIADYTDVESLHVTEDDAALITALQIGSRYTNPGIVVAGVATTPHLVTEMQRLAALFRPGAAVHFHPTVDAAHRWIERQRGLGAAPG